MSASSRAFCLRSDRVAFDGRVAPAFVRVEGERIAAVGDDPAIAAGIEVVDCGTDAIFPGVVDIHVHVNEPGRTEWEGFETATRAALAGGTTTIVDMPLNSSPVSTTAEALRAKIAATRGKLRVDCAFHGGLVAGNADRMEELAAAGAIAIKAFLVHSGLDEFTAAGEDDLRAAMRTLARLDVPLLAHAEVEIPRPALPAGSRSHAEWLRSRPEEMEVLAVDLLVRLALETGARVHVVHVASERVLDALDEARARGARITAETCPHYLTFAAEDIPDGATLFKCAPPIREAHHREALWDGLRRGTLQPVASDHSPCPPSMKSLDVGDFSRSWGGIASLQFLLSATWTEARRRGISLAMLAEWLCAAPARVVGLATKGRIAPGMDADLVVWSPEAEFVVEPSMIEHRHKRTPYEGRALAGRVLATYLRGRRVAPGDPPAGRTILRGR